MCLLVNARASGRQPVGQGVATLPNNNDLFTDRVHVVQCCVRREYIDYADYEVVDEM